MTVLSWRLRTQAPRLVLCAAVVAAACGKKGPPLAPLRLVPAPVSEMSARRVGSEVRLRFKLPTANANGPGRIDLARVEIYAVTVAPGTVAPPNRDLLTRAYAVGTIAVKPPPEEGEGEPTEKTPPDPRPAPGDEVTFVEELTEARMTPAPLPKAAPPPAPAAAAAPPAGAAPGPVAAPAAALPAGETGLPPVPALPQPDATITAGTPLAVGSAVPPPVSDATAKAAPAAPVQAPAAEPVQTTIVRTYAIRTIARSGRTGQPSARVVVPLSPPPPPPAKATASFTEKTVVVQWTPPPAEGSVPFTFNVYRPDDPKPLNPSPIAGATFEVPGLAVGTEHCFAIRTAAILQNVTIEGDPTTPACVTPRDIFPPAAPQGLSLLLLDGAIELVWDAGTEPDIAGYIVLRGDGPGDTLRALTPAPIPEATFRDGTVQSGSRYVYVVSAVDRAGNASPQSARVEGTAR